MQEMERPREVEERGREAASPDGEQAALTFSSERNLRDTERDRLERPIHVFNP